ncbi:MAG: alpha/beta hydrolase [Chitinophagaceae bacterium]|nr:alpha/beta hydrolase [Rubrivivax sp.]
MDEAAAFSPLNAAHPAHPTQSGRGEKVAPPGAQALPPALLADRQYLGSRSSRIALYTSGAAKHALRSSAPLVLVHSMHAGASAAEVRPVFDKFAGIRPVVALELPGFGSSDRGPQPYTPDYMAQALLSTLGWLRSVGHTQPADVMALSLSCEFATLAALAEPEAFRSLALISPTGLESWRRERYEGGRTRERDGLARLLDVPAIGQSLFSAITTRASMRWFLQRTWGGNDVDERLLAYGHRSAQEPDGHHAPLAFVRGALSTRGIADLYRRLELPVWVAHGVRGTSSNCGALARSAPSRWWTHQTFASGAMPHFEQPRLFFENYVMFMRSAGAHAASARMGDNAAPLATPVDGSMATSIATPVVADLP